MEATLSDYIETIEPPKPMYVWEITLQSGGGGQCIIEVVSQSIMNAVARCRVLQENNPHIRDSSVVRAVRTSLPVPPNS